MDDSEAAEGILWWSVIVIPSFSHNEICCICDLSCEIQIYICVLKI